MISFQYRKSKFKESLLLPIGLLLIVTSFYSCSLIGIHFKVHNPKSAGKYPDFSKETILLGELTPIRENFDVSFYGLDLNLNPTEKTIGGWVEIRAVALTDLDSIQIDLDKVLTIKEIRFASREGSPLKYSRNYRAVYVAMNEKIKKGQSFSVHVNYEGKPNIARKPPWSGGLVWKHDKAKNVWAGVACETEGASTWFPCKDHTSDEPDSARMRFTIPDKKLTVVSNGILQGEEETSNTRSFTWKVNNPINSYNITFYIGDFTKIEDTYINSSGKKLLLNHYVLTPDVEKAKEHFKQVKNHIQIYEYLYGDYPWYDDGFKLVEAPYEGMEHQSAIAYGSGFKNDLYGKEDYVMLHETGHEWFGNAVSVADLADVWLQEGITTYGEALYLEKEYGSNIANSHLLIYRWTIKNKRPVVGPYGRRYFDYHDGDVYVKGAWILHTLRNQIQNDSLFLNILRTFYSDQKYKTTNSGQFIKTVNEVTGKEFDWLFKQYLYNRKVPFFEYYLDKDGYIYYRWINTEPDFNKIKVPFIIEGDLTNYDVFPNDKVQRYQLKKGTNYTMEVSIDNSKSLFGYKKNKRIKKKYNNSED